MTREGTWEPESGRAARESLLGGGFGTSTALGHDVRREAARATRQRAGTEPHRSAARDELGAAACSDRHVATTAPQVDGDIDREACPPSDHPYELRCSLRTLAWLGGDRTAYDEAAWCCCAGRGGQGTSHWHQRELWAPSRVPEVNTREVPKWMEPADIAAVVEGFAAATRVALAAGLDGVEVNAGQYSLVRQFLSGLTNHRDDEWGADRTRFLREVLTAVRAAAGPDAVVALRLCGDELAPWAGITPEQAPELAASIAADDGDARIDLLTIVRGSIYSASATRPDGHTPPGFNLELTASVRKAVERITGDGHLVDKPQVIRIERAA